MEAGAGRSGAQVGVCANVEVEVDVEEKRKKEKWVLSESGFESGESSAETNVDDTTDYDLGKRVGWAIFRYIRFLSLT